MGIDVIGLVKQLSDEQLLELGNRGASTDYAVRHYNNPRHPKFYKQRALLLRAVRRAMQINFPDTRAWMRQRTLEMLGIDPALAEPKPKVKPERRQAQNSVGED